VSWTPPKEAKGLYRAVVAWDLGPYSQAVGEAAFSVDGSRMLAARAAAQRADRRRR